MAQLFFLISTGCHSNHTSGRKRTPQSVAKGPGGVGADRRRQLGVRPARKTNGPRPPDTPFPARGLEQPLVLTTSFSRYICWCQKALPSPYQIIGAEASAPRERTTPDRAALIILSGTDLGDLSQLQQPFNMTLQPLHPLITSQLNPPDNQIMGQSWHIRALYILNEQRLYSIVLTVSWGWDFRGAARLLLVHGLLSMSNSDSCSLSVWHTLSQINSSQRLSQHRSPHHQNTTSISKTGALSRQLHKRLFSPYKYKK